MSAQLRFLLRLGCAAGGALLFYLAMRYLLPWTLPFLLALTLSACLERPVQWLRRRFGFRRGFSAAVLTLALLGLLVWLLVWGCGRLLAEATALLSRLPELLTPLPGILTTLEQRLDRFCEACPEGLQHWFRELPALVAGQTPQVAARLSAEVLELASTLAEKLPDLALFTVTTVLAVFYTASRFPQIRSFLLRQLPPAWQASALGVGKSALVTLGRWLRAEATLVAVTFAQLLVGLWLLRVDYALLMAVLTALVDALPILGAGTVLVPWGLFSLLTGAVPRGVGLLALYAVIAMVRSLLEPKLMAAQADLPPIATLAAMYVGYRALGLGGMLALPFLLLLFKQLQDGGWIHIWK